MFKLITKRNKARLGEFHTKHGVIKTPVFMNVATQGAIKGALSADDLKVIGCSVALANTYHLHVRPGDELISRQGGLHRFMAWDGPILTDSGGFQIFSLAKLRKISEEGVTFSSHIDGRKIFMSPEDSIGIQQNLGSDIMMAFDECVAIPATREYTEASCERTYRWLVRCKAAARGVLFGINQGAVFADLRIAHMKRIAELDLPGYAIGGLAVGESAGEMYDIVETVEEHMPADKPRYLMGVGTPQNIAECVARGVDFFDCVMPARNGRHGRLYLWDGSSINIKNEQYKEDGGPIDERCSCPVCKRYTRSYIRHLFAAGEMLGLRLAVLHNLYFYNTLMERIRESLTDGTFEQLRSELGGENKEHKEYIKKHKNVVPQIEDDRLENPSQYYKSIYEDREQMFKHFPYSLEEKLTMAVINADEAAAMEAFKEIAGAGSKATLATDSVRSAKNSVICSCVLLTRAAIQAGVAPDEAFALSDAVIKHIEGFSTNWDVLKYEEDVLMLFIRLVKRSVHDTVSLTVRRAIRYIDAHLSEKITLSQMAAHVGVNSNYLSGLFHREMNVPISKYIVSRKIKESVYFLKYSEHTISDIAMLYGFADQSYYTAVFRKIMGITPALYRESAKTQRQVNKSTNR